MKGPKVSVIVPNYNHELFLKHRLDSIFNQKYQDFEVILLDDASTDGSRELLLQYKSHPKVSHLVLNEVNSGSPFKQWKRGIDLAKGEYIWIAESDDYCHTTFLEKTISQLTTEIGVCYVQTHIVSDDETILSNMINYTKDFVPNIWEKDYTINGAGFIAEYLLFKNVIPNASGVVFNINLINKKTFSSRLLNMKMCGDWLFWVCLCKNTDLHFVSESLNYFRTHQNVSRLHTTVETKKLRLKEEAIVRKHIIKLTGASNALLESGLYKRWYSLHKTIEIFSLDFYSIVVRPKKILSFILGFLNSKIKLW